jgi:hypothetical protein
MAAMEDLLATIDETIELLGGKSGEGTADETQPTGGDTPSDASQTGPASDDELELVERLGSVSADLHEIIHRLSNDEFPEEPFGPGHANIGEQFADIYNDLSPSGKREIIDLLASGELGEDGKKIAELLPKMTGVDGQDFWGPDAYNQIRDIMVESEDAEGIIAAIESISNSEPSNGEPPEEPFGPGHANIGEQFADIYNDLLPSERREIIDLLASGELGEDGKKIAELLPKMTGVDGQDFWGPDAYNQIRDIMVESEDAEEIIAAIESISE